MKITVRILGQAASESYNSMLARGFPADQRMSPSEFDSIAYSTLEDVAAAVDASGAEVDVEAKGDGVLELTFEDDSKMVINRHGAAKEIWVAARAGGFHFRWDGSQWLDTRASTELFAALSKLVSAQGGVPVVLARKRKN